MKQVSLPVSIAATDDSEAGIGAGPFVFDSVLLTDARGVVHRVPVPAWDTEGGC